MQTLTRLLGRLWDALFPPPRPRTYKPTKRYRAAGVSSLPNYADCEESLRPSVYDRQLHSPQRANRLTISEESDDIAFCSWMYYLN